MAVRSVIDIEINDEAFKKFSSLFQDYRTKLAETPGLWAATDEAAQGVKSTSEAILAALLAQGELTSRLVLHHQQSANIVGKTERGWDGIAKSTKAVAGNLLSMTTSLIRFSTLTAAFTGLIGGGSLFGLDKLGGFAGSNRRTAQGLGSAYGEPSAFASTLGRLVNPGQFLGGVNDSLTDATKRFSLYGAGLREQDISGKDTTQVAAALLPKLKELFDKTPDAYLAQTIEARRLGQFVSVEDARRIKATSPQELQGILSQNQQAGKALALDDDTARKWQNFTVNLGLAGSVIENTLVKGLTGLTEPLGHLSASVTGVVASLLGSNSLKDGIDKVGHSLDWLAQHIDTPEFKTDVANFITGIEAMGKAIGRFVIWFGGGAAAGGGDSGGSAPTTPSGTQLPGGISVRPDNRTFKQWWNDVTTGTGQPESAGLGSSNDPLELIRRLEASGDSAVSPAGAVGRYQIMPSTAQHYGFKGDLTNPQYSKIVAEAIWSDLGKRYKNNLEDQLIAYNAGPGVADKYEKSGRDRSVLPAETRRYLDRAAQINPTITVRIENPAGANVNVTGAQVAN